LVENGLTTKGAPLADTIEAEIHEYIVRRLSENIDTTTIKDELVKKWPVRVNDETVAFSFIGLAQIALKPTKPKLYEIPCPSCGGMPSQKAHCQICVGDGTVLVSIVPRDKPSSGTK
jgi:hypothetical protein